MTYRDYQDPNADGAEEIAAAREAEEIARELDGRWTCEPRDGDPGGAWLYWNAFDPNLRFTVTRTDNGQRDIWHVHTCWPTQLLGHVDIIAHSINVSRSRGVATLAREIERRFLPAAIEATRKAEAHKEAHEEAEEREQHLRDAVAAAFGKSRHDVTFGSIHFRNRFDGTARWDHWRPRDRYNRGVRVKGDISDANGVTLTLAGLSPRQLFAIVTALDNLPPY